MANDYDVLVVGGGLAGLTAGMFGARYGLKTGLIEQMMGGAQIRLSPAPRNLPWKTKSNPKTKPLNPRRGKGPSNTSGLAGRITKRPVKSGCSIC